MFGIITSAILSTPLDLQRVGMGNCVLNFDYQLNSKNIVIDKNFSIQLQIDTKGEFHHND